MVCCCFYIDIIIKYSYSDSYGDEDQKIGGDFAIMTLRRGLRFSELCLNSTSDFLVFVTIRQKKKKESERENKQFTN